MVRLLSKIGEFFSQAWASVVEYETMRGKGWILAKSEDGEYFWVGYDD